MIKFLSSMFLFFVSSTFKCTLGHDQYATLYKKYLVRGASYNVEIRSVSESASTISAVWGLAGVSFNDWDEESDFDNVTDMMEAPPTKWNKWRKWGAGSSTTRPVATDYGATVFKGYVNCRQLASERQTEYTWPGDFRAALGANPADAFSQSMIIWASSLATGTVPATEILPTMIGVVKLVQYVELTEPIFVGIS